jgi:glycosyltransferase involved in cell wall biosynthesis
MRDHLLYTLVVVGHNDEKFTKTTLESIKSQTHDRYEVIIIDGGSTDNTLEVAYSVPLKRRRVYNFFEHSTYHMWNKGLKLARGRYILFMKAGTYFTSNLVLERMEKDIEDLRHPDLILTAGLGYHRASRALHLAPISIRRLTKGLLPTTLASRLFRVDTLRMLGGFDTSFRVRSSYELVCRYVSTPTTRIVQLSNVITDFTVNLAKVERFLEYHRETPKIIRKNFGRVKLMTYLFSHSAWIALRYWVGQLHFHSADEIK